MDSYPHPASICFRFLLIAYSFLLYFLCRAYFPSFLIIFLLFLGYSVFLYFAPLPPTHTHTHCIFLNLLKYKCARTNKLRNDDHFVRNSLSPRPFLSATASRPGPFCAQQPLAPALFVRNRLSPRPFLSFIKCRPQTALHWIFPDTI